MYQLVKQRNPPWTWGYRFLEVTMKLIGETTIRANGLLVQPHMSIHMPLQVIMLFLLVVVHYHFLVQMLVHLLDMQYGMGLDSIIYIEGWQ